jgi:hypothetical protein
LLAKPMLVMDDLSQIRERWPEIAQCFQSKKAYETARGTFLTGGGIGLMRIAASYHESGHAVVAAMLGYSVDWAEISDTRGRCAFGMPQTERHEALILLAGTAAQHRACPHTPLGRSDARRIAMLPADRYRYEAEALVERHWPLVEDVAARLLERGEVGGVEVYQVCSGLRAQWVS